MSAPKITEEASRKKKEEFAAIINPIFEIAMAPVERLGENPRESVGVSYTEAAALMQPATIRAELRRGVRETEQFLAANMDHLCAKQGLDWSEQKFASLIPKPGWLVERLSDHLDRIKSEGEILRDALVEAGIHSNENYGVLPAIKMGLKTFANPLIAIQNILGNHPVQKQSRKLDSELETAFYHYTDAVTAFVTELVNEFELGLARILDQIRSSV